jgi:hypothetical protein
MRFFILAVTLIVAFANSAVAQIENPFADVLKRAAEIEAVDTDGRHTTLLKQSLAFPFVSQHLEELHDRFRISSLAIAA